MQPAMTFNSVIVGLAPPPPGVTANFDHPESIGYRLAIALAVCLVLATCVLLLRLYTRYFIIHIIGADDCKQYNSRKKSLDANNTDIIITAMVPSYLLEVTDYAWLTISN
jgi:hypothetical protein